MHRTLSVVLSLGIFFGASAQSITQIESAGWFESAYVNWTDSQSADSYNVYVTGEGLTDHKIDAQLTRNYGSYFRADIPGLKAGNYTIKIAAVLNDIEVETSTTPQLTVSAMDRTGFAFSGNRVPGAYNADGTPKSGAVVLYITQNTKNTVSLDVTGANANPCVGLQTILEGFKKGNDNRPLIVRLIGQITDLSYMDKGDIVVENNNNASSYITIEGIGEDATADGWGLRIKNASNVEVRNIGFMNTDSDEGDDLGLQQNNDHIWVHHCDFFYGHAGSAGDQAKGDGALDCKKSTYVTFSYNHFWDTGKSNLLGLSEGTTEGLYITYHHNWYDHSDSRHPRVRFYSAHVYNNYYDGIAKYGVGATEGSSVFVEANYFRNCKYPILTSMQGSDVYDASTQSNDYSDMPTFSKEDGGSIKAYNNTILGATRFVPYGEAGYPNSTVDFDAYLASTRNETIPATVKSVYGANTYNNFDTNGSVMYSYTPESPENAKARVIAEAGRMKGGDFKWTFNNAVDDASYDVNTALKSALVSYQTALVSIQEDGNGSGGETGGEGGTGGTGGTGGGTITGDVVHNFTADGLNSTFFSITGSLSTTKGTVTYGGLTLTQCLKIESTTNISFATSEESTLTLVFNNDFTGGIKVDGVDKSASAGVMSTTLAAGSHQITKKDVANVYYIIIDYPGGTGGTGTNHPPTVSSALSDELLQSGFSQKTVDLSSVFSDIDQDQLTLCAESDNTSVLTVGVNNNILTITEVGIGNANVSVMANDGAGGTVTDILAVKVNGAPAIANSIPDLTLSADFASFSFSIADTFTDPNADNLTLSAVSSATSVVTVSISGTSIVLSEVGIGTATITVTANDNSGGETTTTFAVAVESNVLSADFSSFKIYPNPANDYLKIEGFKSLEDVEIYSMAGVKIPKGDNLELIDLSTLKPGTYLLKATVNGQSQAQMFIKK